MWNVLFLATLVLLINPLPAEIHESLRDTGRVCAVDMGSNTFKFIVAEIKNGEYLQYTDIRKGSGVGDDLRKSEKESGRKVISADKVKEIRAILSDFQDECERQTHSRKMHAIATAAFREAENGKTISQQLQQDGIDLQILTAEGESIYAYEAATSGEPGLSVIDLGSRTTEFVAKRAMDNYEWVALPIGYKTAWDDFYQNTETFSEASAQHLKKLHELVEEKGEKILSQGSEVVVIEVGETASYVLGIPQSEIEGKIITHFQIQKKLKDLAALTPKSFAELKSNFKDASKVLPRLVFLDDVLSLTRFEKFRATDRELNVAIVYRLSRC